MEDSTNMVLRARRTVMEHFQKGDRIQITDAEPMEDSGTIAGFYPHFVLVELDSGFRTSLRYQDFLSGGVIHEGHVIIDGGELVSGAISPVLPSKAASQCK